ncbi:MAG: hypothetical protein DWQ08_02755 [Proteobacteria bacterium]|nr:MAG: hypothetical protein DWQ08_02755 [Pseudomonadota bacterium]
MATSPLPRGVSVCTVARFSASCKNGLFGNEPHCRQRYGRRRSRFVDDRLMTSMEGKISVSLRHSDGRVTAAAISSDRPLRVARLFEDRDLQWTLATVPRVFSVCGVAQGLAASRAAQAALGCRPPAFVESARETLLLAETAREHLWRILIDWPRARGEQPGSELSFLGGLIGRFRDASFGSADPFRLAPYPVADAADRDLAIRELREVIAERVFGVDPERWLAVDGELGPVDARGEADRHLAWIARSGWSGAGAVRSEPLPEQCATEIGARLGAADADTFIARPQWRGSCRETSAFSRHADHPRVAAVVDRYGPGLLARLVARLVDLALIPSRMIDLHQSPYDQSGHTWGDPSRHIGVACVNAARGLLVHRLEIADGRVRRYRILAPTEWNFHPDGVAAQGLLTLGGNTADIERQARAWLEAVDPCVEYQIGIA